MRKSIKRSLIATLALSQFVGLTQPFLSSVQANETVALTSAGQKRLDDVKKAIGIMEAKSTKENVKKAMNQFTELYHVSDEQGNIALRDNGQGQAVFDKIMSGRNKLPQVDKNEASVYFANHMAIRFINDEMFYYDHYFEGLLNDKYDDATLSKIRQAGGKMNTLLSETAEIIGEYDKSKYKVTLKGDALVFVKPRTYETGIAYEDPYDALLAVDENAPLPDGTVGFDHGESNDTWEDVYYEEVEGKPVRVTVTYTRVNGKVTSAVKRDVVSKEEAFAGTSQDWKVLDDEIEADTIREEIAKAEEAAMSARSDLTLHYTVTKADGDAYYYDSGIRLTAEGEANYLQVKDVLYQLALRAEGYLAEDEGKFLIVVEGKPVLIREAQKTYSREEVEEMFKGFKTVDMRIMSTRIGTTASLEEQLVSGTTQSVKLNGEIQALTHHPLVENNQVLLSVEELAQLLGLNYEKIGNKHTVSNGTDVVQYEKDVRAAVVNGKITETVTPSVVNDANALMVDITALIETFGIEMVWDEETSTMLLSTQLTE